MVWVITVAAIAGLAGLAAWIIKGAASEINKID